MGLGLVGLRSRVVFRAGFKVSVGFKVRVGFKARVRLRVVGFSVGVWLGFD